MTPHRWNQVLAPDIGWVKAYAEVEREAKALLIREGRGTGNTFTTAELVEELYPERFAKGEGITARKRIYKALAALADKGLKDCATKGEPRKLKHTNQMVRPWLWHAPVNQHPQLQAYNEAAVRVGERARIADWISALSLEELIQPMHLADQIRSGAYAQALPTEGRTDGDRGQPDTVDAPAPADQTPGPVGGVEGAGDPPAPGAVTPIALKVGDRVMSRKGPGEITRLIPTLAVAHVKLDAGGDYQFSMGSVTRLAEDASKG